MSQSQMIDKAQISFTKTLILTSIALIAFAANSVLCRLALGEGTIDASSFTAIRLLSGILMLWIILLTKRKKNNISSSGSWIAAIMLFLYAAAFSFAYISLETATGALILFGAVQLTMIISAHVKGERLSALEWLGVLIALAGFIYLVLPGASAPSVGGFVLMALAGIAWGFYSLIGGDSTNPLADTTINFTKTLPFIIILIAFSIPYFNISFGGVVLAVSSGAIASGLGYVIWYMALRGLKSSQAAVVQFLVPVLAATGGVIFISEEISLRLIISSVMILGGVVIVIYKPEH